MDITKRLESVIDTLADMHDGEVDKNYPEEKCLACLCQEDIQNIIDYITQQQINDSKPSLIGKRCTKFSQKE